GFSQQVYVKGYYRSNGTYVQPHYRTAPNHTLNDNWSTVGNVNPYTGIAGTKPRQGSYSSTKIYNDYNYNQSYVPSKTYKAKGIPVYPNTYSSPKTYKTKVYHSIPKYRKTTPRVYYTY